ncbi:MAG: response regulator [Kordiimonadaceae bacterium]|nr:response regulator [Kordiimonadaceae bacterium]MBO6567671.1 response regulator [Kordiimonadaceae bacterium]MBO6963115.1 response regulator [Kordiimonadaceae bacterium]
MKILLVDDDPIVLESLDLTLKEFGHEVTPVNDGVYAVEEAARGDFDLLITDLIMPGIEGIETIRHFQKHHPGIGIIAISGGARGSSTPYLNIAKAVGAKATLAKPFTASELNEAVDQVAVASA